MAANLEINTKLNNDINQNTLQVVERNDNTAKLSQHLHRFNELCSCLRTNLANAITIKSNNSVNNQTQQLKILETEMLILMSELKNTNREINNISSNTKGITFEKKKVLDQLNLQLESLLYEQMHLEKEIAVSPADLTDESLGEHKLNLNRLTFELQQQKHLLSQVEELKLRKKSLAHATLSKRNFLKSVLSQLDTIVADVQPLQTHLTLLELLRPPPETRFLPKPLYLLFCTAHAHIIAFDASRLSLSIEGDVEAAQKLTESLESNEMNIVDEKVDSLPILDVDHEQDSSTTSILSHPLCVVLTVTNSDDSTSVVLRFSYIPTLHIILLCARPLAPLSSVSDFDFDAQLLTDLFPDDDGLSFPAPPSSVWPSSDTQHLTSLGRPFRWCQSLGGSHFLHPNEPLSNPLVPPNLPEVLSRISKRIESQRSLDAQIKFLQARSYPFDITSLPFCYKPRTHFISFVISNINDFKQVTTSRKWGVSSSTSTSLSSSITSKNTSYKEQQYQQHIPLGSRFYRANFTRGKTSGGYELDTYICIPPSYPDRLPIFHIQLVRSPPLPTFPNNELLERTADPNALKRAYKDEKLLDICDNALVDLEREMNYNNLNDAIIALTPLMGDDISTGSNNLNILSFLIRKLQICFDIYVETDSGSARYSQGTYFSRAFQGRDRQRPFSLQVSNVSNPSFIFAQSNQ